MGVNPKDFKKLVAMCRKLGIQHYKCADYEFTLGPSPLRSSRTAKRPRPPMKLDLRSAGVETDDIDEADELIPTAGLSQEDLLFWSTGVAQEITES